MCVCRGCGIRPERTLKAHMCVRVCLSRGVTRNREAPLGKPFFAMAAPLPSVPVGVRDATASCPRDVRRSRAGCIRLVRQGAIQLRSCIPITSTFPLSSAAPAQETQRIATSRVCLRQRHRLPHSPGRPPTRAARGDALQSRCFFGCMARMPHGRRRCRRYSRSTRARGREIRWAAWAQRPCTAAPHSPTLT